MAHGVVGHPVHVVEPAPVSRGSEDTASLCGFNGKFDAAGDMEGHLVQSTRHSPSSQRTCLKSSPPFQVNGAMIPGDPDDTGDFCNADPGLELERDATGCLPAMTPPWRRLLTVKTKVPSGQRKFHGETEIIRNLLEWLGLRPFAKPKSGLAVSYFRL
jgi:hypothetical protein